MENLFTIGSRYAVFHRFLEKPVSIKKISDFFNNNKKKITNPMHLQLKFTWKICQKVASLDLRTALNQCPI